MDQLFIGVSQVSLLIRHSRSLKDKRQVVRSLVQKLRNMGCSVTECGWADEPKRTSIGFTFAGASHGFVEKSLDEASRLFIGDYDVLRTQRDIFDYSGEGVELFRWEEDAV